MFLCLCVCTCRCVHTFTALWSVFLPVLCVDVPSLRIKLGGMVTLGDNLFGLGLFCALLYYSITLILVDAPDPNLHLTEVMKSICQNKI